MKLLLFDPAGPVALQEGQLIRTAVLLMLLIVIPTLVAFLVIARKYRAGNPNAKYDPGQSHGFWKQLALWVLPAIIVAMLAMLGWKNADALDPSQPIASSMKPITIQVVALPWKWLFIYPAENIATVNFIQFPENVPVHFDLTADGPISSFWIPQLGSQIYAMAAMQTQLNLMASKTGEFVGKDTEINGAGYAGMHFIAKSTSQEDFDAWVRSVQASSTYAPLTDDAYAALAVPSENSPPAYYSSVANGLYNEVIMKFMEPAGAMPGMQM